MYFECECKKYRLCVQTPQMHAPVAVQHSSVQNKLLQKIHVPFFPRLGVLHRTHRHACHPSSFPNGLIYRWRALEGDLADEHVDGAAEGQRKGLAVGVAPATEAEDGAGLEGGDAGGVLLLLGICEGDMSLFVFGLRVGIGLKWTLEPQFEAFLASGLE